MKVLFQIMLVTGVVFFGFHTTSACELLDEKDKKKVVVDENVKTESDKEKKDTVIKTDIQVGDTLVFDDFDEDDDDDNSDPGLIALQPNVNQIWSANQTDDSFETDFRPDSKSLNEEPLTIACGIHSASLSSEISSSQSDQKVAKPIVTPAELKVYPNPAVQNQEIHITHNLEGNVQMTLMDMTGKSVYSQEFQNSELSFNPPAVGMYIIVLTNGIQSSSTRLVVK